MKLYETSYSEVKKLIEGKEPTDNYRRMFYFGEDNSLGFYYKDFIDLEEVTKENVDELIKANKEARSYSEYTWEHYVLLNRIALYNRLDELKGLTELNRSPISGYALYQGYPVGVLVPRLLPYYQSLDELNELSLNDKKRIFKKASVWVDELIKRDVYPVNIYGGNILVNPDNNLDVVLDGLDDIGVVRIESKNFVKYLKYRGRDFEEESHENLGKIKKLYLK